MVVEQAYSRLSVLVIDDDSIIRRIMRGFLGKLGVRVISEAADGISGLLEVQRGRPNIVFCDIHMKPLGGIEFLKQLRAAKQHAIANTHVIMLTSDCTADTVSEVKGLGANGYLVKPVTPNQLKARIDGLIAASRNSG